MQTSHRNQKEGTDTESYQPAKHRRDLTKFQTRILAELSGDPQYGLALKRALEDYYGEEVNHGRLYPNLDDLANKGLLEKSELDKRTNEYALTDAGHQHIQAEVQHLVDTTMPEGEMVVSSHTGGDD